MIFIPGMYSGYWAKGSLQLHEQVVINDHDEMDLNSYYVGYVPGIY